MGDMKMHTPLFVVGLLIFVTPFLGLPSYIETIIIAVFGIAVMLLVSSYNTFVQKEMRHESKHVATSSESTQQK